MLKESSRGIISDFFTESPASVEQKVVKSETPDVKTVESSITPEVKKPKKTGKFAGFKGIAGMVDLKKEFTEELILPLKNKAIFDKFKVGIPNGILLFGPPGCGKTFIVEKLSEEIELPLIKNSVADMGSTYQHQTSINIKKMFEDARKQAPCILFLDEIDAITSKRDSQTTDAKSEELSQFLQELNNIAKDNVIVIGATNRPDEMDSAILRSGRFDNHIYVGPPDKEAREDLFKLYTEKIGRPVGKINYVELAEFTHDYTSSDIKVICDEVARNMAGKSIGKKKVSLINTKDILEVVKTTQSSLIHVDVNIFDKFKKL